MTAADVFSMARRGDEVAVRVVEETCDYLGVACVNICRVLDPDAILLTGGLSKAEGLVDKVRRASRWVCVCFFASIDCTCNRTAVTFGPVAILYAGGKCIRFWWKYI